MEMLIFITTILLGTWLYLKEEEKFIIKTLFATHLLIIIMHMFFDMLKGVI